MLNYIKVGKSPRKNSKHDVIFEGGPRGSLKQKCKRRFKILSVVFICFILLLVIFLFVGFPLIFMHSIELQRLLMFTNLNLPSDQKYFENYNVTGFRNLYVTVQDGNDDSNKVLSLGIWHLLPHAMINQSQTIANFSYEYALWNSSHSVILYFHGTGETRSDSDEKYEVLRQFSHIVTFDYRSYGDSSKAEMSEELVVNDCVQLYKWLTFKTTSPILFWGHSLGSALAARTMAILKSIKIKQPMGLVLESAFTTMAEEIYVHPYGKIFAWLPWFKSTVVDPLYRNGFIFDTSKNILEFETPLMILCAEDDSIVPYKFGTNLFDIAKNHSKERIVLYYQFPYNLGRNHIWIYEDERLPVFIEYFIYISKYTSNRKISSTWINYVLEKQRLKYEM